MPAPRRIKTRRARAVDFAVGITVFWGITAFVFLTSGGRSSGELLALFSLAGIGAWIWAIRTIRADQAAGKSLAELQAMSPDRFEDWVGARFRELGYSVKTCGAQGDHGVDLLAEKPGETAVIQCKNYKK